jgi:hypothetical protein
MRRAAVGLLFVCAFGGIGSGLAHGAVTSGLRLTAATQPAMRHPILGAGAEHAGLAMKTIVFRGYTIKVPASWPVYQLSKDPNQCVRYDVNAVYLGTPGPNQNCPPGLVGTADTVSIGGPSVLGGPAVTFTTGRRAQVGDLRSAAGLRAAPGTIMQNPWQHEFTMAIPSAWPTVTATYGTDPNLIVQVLTSLRRLADRLTQPGPLQPRWVPPSPQPTISLRPRYHPSPSASSGGGWSLPGTIGPQAFPTAVSTPPTSHPTTRPSVTPSPTGAPASTPPAQPPATGGSLAPGFDTCTAPSLPAMRAWRARYSVAAIYIGGQEMACDYGNLSASWVSSVEQMGWSLMPIFVGLQAPCNSYSAEVNPGKAASEGAAAATQAISDAKLFNFGTGSPIYFDMEAYDHTNAGCRNAVLTFLDAWTRQLDKDGYVSGVYSSADAAAIDLQNTTTIAGHPLAEPQAMWFALWDNATNLTGSPYLTWAVWPATQRSKQYTGGHVVNVGGFSLDIDSDLVNSAVAR